MLDNTITRFQSGIANNGGFSNVRDTDLFSDIPVGDWTRYHNYYTDYDQYVAADYVVTGAGTAALTAGDGGLLLITSPVSTFQSLQKTPAAFSIQAGKPLWGEIDAALDSLLGTLLVGLLNVTVTPFTGASQTDGIYLLSTVTTGALSFNIAVGGVITTVATGVSVVAGQQFKFRFYYDGACYDQFPNGRVFYELSGPGVTGTVRGVITLPAGTAFPGATLVTPTLAVNASTAVARTLTVDQVDVFKSRINPNSTPSF